VESATIFWVLPLTAFTTGLMGSLHCLGMCGGISATVALASPLAGAPGPRVVPIAPAATAPSPAASTAQVNVLAFNAGRLASYAMAGALAGTLGGGLAGLGQGWIISETMPVRTALFVFANLMIVFTGLYLMGVPQLLAPLERAGGLVWRHISPHARRLLPLTTRLHAVLFGMLWGWIPCGMVYAVLLTAMSAGSAPGGAMTMLAFGVGTLPVMVGAGWSAGSLRGWTQKPRIRLIAGVAVVAMGLFGLSRVGTLAPLQAFGAFCMTLIAPGAGQMIAP
jgi:sulfite exporter TauE/SafE